MLILGLFSVIINVLIATGGEYGLTLEEWKTVRYSTQEIFKREFPGKKVKLKFIPPILTSSNKIYDLSNKEEGYYTWKRKLRSEKKKGLWLVVLPPIEDMGSRYITGLARSDCFKNFNLSTIVVFLQGKNHLGENRLLESSYAIAHELGHAMGVSHIEGFNIMDPNPLPLVNQYGSLSFDRKSKKYIRRCAN